MEEYNCDDHTFNDTLNRDRDDLGLSYAIVITYNGNGAPTIRNPVEDYLPVVPTGGHVVVGPPNVYTGAGHINIIVNGTTGNGSLKIYGIFPFGGLYLNNVNITNPEGPAINIQSNLATPVHVHLVGGGGRKNYLSDGFDYAPTGTEDAKGTFFSESRLTFLGSGYLEVRAVGERRTGNPARAIAADADIRILSGNITIRESAGDGIYANNDIRIRGGTIQIISTGDAIQSGRPNNSIHVTGGKVRARTSGVRSHGIAGEDSVVISENADIRIESSGPAAKGIRARGHVAVTGGNIGITVSGRRHIDTEPLIPDTGRASGVKALSFEMTGGTLAIDARQAENGRGINTDGDVTVRGSSDVTIHSRGDGINVNGYFRMYGGTVTSRSIDAQDIDCRGRYTHNGGTLNAVIDGRPSGGF
jgi:hypothetical protein